MLLLFRSTELSFQKRDLQNNVSYHLLSAFARLLKSRSSEESNKSPSSIQLYNLDFLGMNHAGFFEEVAARDSCGHFLFWSRYQCLCAVRWKLDIGRRYSYGPDRGGGCERDR